MNICKRNSEIMEEICFHFRGSEVYEKAHGFGLKTEEEFSHSGWWKNGRPNGFGLRIYSDNTVDIGVWEDQERFHAAKK